MLRRACLPAFGMCRNCGCLCLEEIGITVEFPPSPEIFFSVQQFQRLIIVFLQAGLKRRTPMEYSKNECFLLICLFVCWFARLGDIDLNLGGSNLSACFVFRRLRVQISAKRLAILTDVCKADEPSVTLLRTSVSTGTVLPRT
jgi:hypothetical protein